MSLFRTLLPLKKTPATEEHSIQSSESPTTQQSIQQENPTTEQNNATTNNQNSTQRHQEPSTHQQDTSQYQTNSANNDSKQSNSTQTRIVKIVLNIIIQMNLIQQNNTNNKSK